MTKLWIADTGTEEVISVDVGTEKVDIGVWLRPATDITFLGGQYIYERTEKEANSRLAEYFKGMVRYYEDKAKMVLDKVGN